MGGENVKPGKGVYIIFFFFENERVGNSYPGRYRQNPRSFCRPNDEKDHVVRIISRNLVEPNELRQIPRLSVLHAFRDETGQPWGSMWHLHGRHMAHGWAKCHALRIA